MVYPQSDEQEQQLYAFDERTNSYVIVGGEEQQLG